MPYIEKTRAEDLDPSIDALIERIHQTGELNYTISRLAAGLVHAKGLSYSNLSAVRAVFGDASQEFYRRLMEPYENDKANYSSNVGVRNVYWPHLP